MSKAMLKYPIKWSSRKTCAIKILSDGQVVILAPHRMPVAIIEQFVEQKSDWIATTRAKVLSLKEKRENVKVLSDDEIRYLADDAKRLIPPRVKYYSKLMGVTYNRITVRCQRTRWGSCSTRNNLNFNCLLMLTPEDVLDYVIVHELCHLKQMNHSKEFWAEVERVLPDYKMSYEWLKKHGGELMAQLPDNK